VRWPGGRAWGPVLPGCAAQGAGGAGVELSRALAPCDATGSDACVFKTQQLVVSG
jgi:hypothetical protein